MSKKRNDCKKRKKDKRIKKPTKVDVYFDETNHTGNIGLTKDEEKLSYGNFDEWYNFLYIGFANPSEIREKILSIEKECFPNSKNGEIKGARLTRKDLFSMPKQNIDFYNKVFDVVLEHKKIIQFGSYNRIELLVRKGLINEDSMFWFLRNNRIEYNNFIGSLTKFINDQIAFDFFKFTSKNKRKNDIFNYIILKLNESKKAIRAKENARELIKAFDELIYILNLLIHQYNSKENITKDFNKWEYDFINHALQKISKEKNIIPIVHVDKHEQTMNALKNNFHILPVISKSEPLSRIPDYILSLFRRIVRTVHMFHDENRKISQSFVIKNEYPDKLFDFSKNQPLLNLLKKALQLFDSKTHWETFSGIMKLETVTLIQYLNLISSTEEANSEMLNSAILEALW